MKSFWPRMISAEPIIVVIVAGQFICVGFVTTNKVFRMFILVGLNKHKLIINYVHYFKMQIYTQYN